MRAVARSHRGGRGPLCACTRQCGPARVLPEHLPIGRKTTHTTTPLVPGTRAHDHRTTHPGAARAARHPRGRRQAQCAGAGARAAGHGCSESSPCTTNIYHENTGFGGVRSTADVGGTVFGDFSRTERPRAAAAAREAMADYPALEVGQVRADCGLVVHAGHCYNSGRPHARTPARDGAARDVPAC